MGVALVLGVSLLFVGSGGWGGDTLKKRQGEAHPVFV